MAGEAQRRRLRALLKRAGVRVAGDLTMVEQAFVIESFAKENGGSSNERMEFFGDSVLGYITAQWLFERFPNEPEGQLTVRKASIVNDGQLAISARRLGFGDLLQLGTGMRNAGGAENTSILADAFEAFVAALHVRYGPEKARTFVVNEHIATLDHAPGALLDAKTRLQHYAQEHLSATPAYRERSAGTAQVPKFHSCVLVNGKTLGTGTGSSKKSAPTGGRSGRSVSFGREMKLKKIKAFGFKTFAEATALDFSSGINAIVGPNGSGKSNMVDAFRWVLGEMSSKSLRSGKLEDVIFAGTDKRKPLGLAEVSLTFDNEDRRLPTDFSEVEITRRAYRAGDSEYFINRTQVRLRDIVELLMGTGLGPGSYAIVSQGQIDSILTSKPTERRALFEETAGINKFLARKHESMRRLEQTETNAIRISDLIAEIERRIPELDTQVRRAKRYRKVSARVRDLEILSYMRASASRRTEREALRGELERQEDVRGAAAAKVAQLGANLAELRTRAYQQELHLEEIRGAAQTKRGELARIEADYAAALARREALEAQSTQTSEDVARVAAERESLGATIAQLEAKLAPLAVEVDAARERELEAQRALAAARAQLDAIFTRLREVEASAAQHAAKKAERRVQGENVRAEAERLEGESNVARDRVAQLEIAAGTAMQKYSERETQLSSLERQLASARTAVESAESGAVHAQETLSATLAAHNDLSGDVKAAESRLHTIEELENSLEGHVPGTRAVVEAWQRNELRGIEGIVSNLITTDERYARAMDVAFGARLSNIITKTSEDAERAIEFLNRSETGRATFLPLDTLASRDAKAMTPDLQSTSGVIGYAHTLVRTQPQFEGVVRFLVGNVLVVDTPANRHRARARARSSRYHRHADRRANRRRRRDHWRPLPSGEVDSCAARAGANVA